MSRGLAHKGEGEAVLERVVLALSAPDALLAAIAGSGSFGVFARADLRRRPRVRLSRKGLDQLLREGAVVAGLHGTTSVWRLSAAGRARALRAQSVGVDGFAVQHGGLEDRAHMDGLGQGQTARAIRSPVIGRLGVLRDASGDPWFSVEEVGAAKRLMDDLEAGHRGGGGCMDWDRLGTGVGRGSMAGGAAQAEAGLDVGRRARERAGAALGCLAEPLRRVVRLVCEQGAGLEHVEQSEGWPARSGKIALKLGLAQLAVAYRRL